MGVVERADAPVPQRTASLVAGVVLVVASAAALAVVEPLASARMGRSSGPWLPLVALGAVMLLGTTKRAFDGFDLGTPIAALLWTAGIVLYAGWYRGSSASWVAVVGAGWALAAIGAAVVIGRAAGSRRDDTAGRIRRAAGIVGWCAVALGTAAVTEPTWLAGAIRPDNPYLALITAIAASGGASALAGGLLLATAAHREPA